LAHVDDAASGTPATVPAGPRVACTHGVVVQMPAK
jgi:hypothetical protein